MPGHSSPRNHFIFIVSQTETLEGEKVSAYAVLQHRLEHGIWGLNKNTKNRKAIKKGARVLFYVSGTMRLSRCFVARADVSERPGPFAEADLPKHGKEEWLYDVPAFKLALENIEWLERPTRILDMRSDLALFGGRDIARWGVLVRGGVRRICEADYSLIVSRSSLLSTR